GVILEEIAMYDDHPFWVLYERAMEAYYGGHTLGHRVLGTRESITALQVEEMRTYFESRYSSDNTVLSLAGRIDFDDMVEQAGRLCGHWRPTGARRDYLPLTDPAPVVEVTHPSSSRHYELLISAAPSAQDDDRFAAAVIADI